MSRAAKEPKTALGKWVRLVRGPLTQEAFAAKVGVHHVTANRWEAAGTGMNSKHMDAIRRTFPKAPPPPVEGMSDPDHSLTADHNAGAGTVEFNDGAIVARDIETEPKETRARLRNAALQAIQDEKKKIAEETRRNPHELGAEKRPDRAQRK